MINSSENRVTTVWDDPGRWFPEGGSNIVDGLADRLEGLLSDGGAGLKRSGEVVDGAWSDITDDGGFFL